MTSARTIEHWGTFEVANFGDVLFPLILSRHLATALPDATITLAGPFGGSAPMGLDRPVRRVRRHDEHGFWDQAATVDGFVLGGGDLLHASPGVVVANGRAERLDAWAFAGEAGLLAEVRPFVWNALGVPFDLPDDLRPLVRAACASVDLLTVRDEGSRQRLQDAGVDRPIQVAPDTAVLIDQVFTAAERATALDGLRAGGHLPPQGTRFVAVHVSFAGPASLAELAGALEEARRAAPEVSFVLVGLGATHGDAATLKRLADQLPPPTWVIPDPTLVQVTAVLDAAEAVVSSSFHAMLVASVLGTTSIGFVQSSFRPAKLVDLATALHRDAWLVDRPSVVASALRAALAGDGAPDPSIVEGMQKAAVAHLDQIADTLATASRPPRDLAERAAAHRHVVERLELARVREQRLKEDLSTLDVHLRSARASARTWEAAYWRDHLERGVDAPRAEPVLDLDAIAGTKMQRSPFRWSLVGPLFAQETAQRLARTFPLDEAELRDGTDGRRSWRYQVRCLLPMGHSTPVRPQALDPVWRRFADELAGPAYRTVLSAITGVDLDELHLEANLFSYGPGAFQEPHPDLPEKVVTHVMWFNEEWTREDGGCLRILRSNDPADAAHELLPSLGWSALFVRSIDSWHSVTPVSDTAPVERRALVATFHRPGLASSMWGEAAD
jgi:polysaccharide pyruvyl transferase WcaK-like protein